MRKVPADDWFLTMDEKTREALVFPLYVILHSTDFDPDVGLLGRDVARFRNQVSREDYKEVLDSLRWIEEHPEQDFSSVLPQVWSLYKDKQVRQFLSTLLQQLVRYESGLADSVLCEQPPIGAK